MLSDEIVITGNRAIARSYAKINLSLDVLGKREDGYHNVEMIMQTVSLFDLIIVDKTSAGVRIATNRKFLPTNEKNIAFAAAMKFFEYTKIRGGCKILIQKNIPVSAGLAGGSGNGAAVLCVLDRLYNTGLTAEELSSIAVGLGADVPYCITGGTALATGIGEILTPLPALPDCNILMVKPHVSVSTPAIYSALDSETIMNHPDTAAITDALSRNDLAAVASNMENVMGAVTERMHPVVRGIRNKLVKNGALGAVMSGSGPTVFGIFEDFKTAKRSHDSFAYQFKEVFLVNNK
ncbi:MAG: 4-(cytidine 5'-diphospho)-2-C-methyl-D-erythritol kinase [Clostridia bacterium]|nr:4-(cytidine 5'-diphospho)-2-C-methyl-D-erythritol kinase [Clostridia bacterium]